MLKSVLAAVPAGIEVAIRSVNISPERARIEMATASHTDAAEIVKAVAAQTALLVTPRNLRYEAGKSVFELEAVAQTEAGRVE